MIKVIVNGDDFGMSQDVNRAISESFRRRVLTSTTLMVNMPFADEAVELSRREGFFNRVGLHLNLTSGTPLTDEIKSCPRFCFPSGDFNGDFARSMSSRFILSRAEKRAVAAEIMSQMKKYRSYRLSALHLDSHHHIHTDFSIMGG